MTARHVGRVLAALLIITTGCAHHRSEAVAKAEGRSGADESGAFFESPQAAVPAINEMLRSHDWQRLARYYDLSGSGIDRASLESGVFFQPARSDRPAQPAGIAGRWQPFAPGFTYAGAEAGPEPGTVSVIVLRRIDQGGGMTQRALDAFPMRKTARGYQILPRTGSQPATP